MADDAQNDGHQASGNTTLELGQAKGWLLLLLALVVVFVLVMLFWDGPVAFSPSSE